MPPKCCVRKCPKRDRRTLRVRRRRDTSPILLPEKSPEEPARTPPYEYARPKQHSAREPSGGDPSPNRHSTALSDSLSAPSVSSACGAHDEADGGRQSSPKGGGAAGRCPAPAPRLHALQAVPQGKRSLHGRSCRRRRAEADEGLRRGPSRRRPSQRRFDGATFLLLRGSRECRVSRRPSTPSSRSAAAARTTWPPRPRTAPAAAASSSSSPSCC